MARGEARCLVCETPLGARGTLTAGCCGVRFHEKCVADHCGQQGARAPGEVRDRSASKTVTVSRVTRRLAPSHQPPSLTSAISPSLLTPALPSPGNRVPRAASSCIVAFRRTPRAPPPSPRDASAHGRQEYHLFVPDHPPTPLATRDLCARLFDIDPARIKLLAKGRALVDESAVADASASGAPILLVGVRCDRLVPAPISPRGQRFAARNVPSKSHGASPSNLSSLVSLSRPSRARWRRSRHTRCGAEIRSCGPSTPRGRTRTSLAFRERVAMRRSGRASGGDARDAVRPPPRPADPGRGPHQFR